MIEVSASIVTFNSASEIGHLLDCFADSEVIFPAGIFVVDNASSDNTVSILKQKYPKVNHIESDRNLGFGAAHNIALKSVNSCYHIFVNPDIVFDNSVICALLKYMDDHEDVVIASPRIMNPDGSEQFLPNRNPTFKYLLGSFLGKKFSPLMKWREEYTRANEYFSEPTEIDFCTGCFMFCRTASLKKCGGFDERYFLHFEDADLTRKMKKLGKTVFVPSVQVLHKWHRENRKLSIVFLYTLISMMKYFKKWHREET